MTLRWPRWIVRGAVASALMGCAAIVGLDEPGELLSAGDDGGNADVAQGDGASGVDSAVAPEVGNGSGRDGPFVVTDRRPVNDDAPLATSAAAGERTIALGKRANIATQVMKAGDVLFIVPATSSISGGRSRTRSRRRGRRSCACRKRRPSRSRRTRRSPRRDGTA